MTPDDEMRAQAETAATIAIDRPCSNVGSSPVDHSSLLTPTVGPRPQERSVEEQFGQHVDGNRTGRSDYGCTTVRDRERSDELREMRRMVLRAVGARSALADVLFLIAARVEVVHPEVFCLVELAGTGSRPSVPMIAPALPRRLAEVTAVGMTMARLDPARGGRPGLDATTLRLLLAHGLRWGCSSSIVMPTGTTRCAIHLLLEIERPLLQEHVQTLDVARQLAVTAIES